MSRRITEDLWFGSVDSDFEVKKMGDTFDEWYGMHCLIVSASDIEALKDGKVLYTNDGEYSTLIMLKEAKE